MIVKRSQLKKELREKMRGGKGTIAITHYCDESSINNCRLLGEIVIPVGGSIGEHQHVNETEFYIIHSGKGEVNSDGVISSVEPGDVVITGNGASHSISNSGNSDLVLSAIIIVK